ncbi:hypothetical protein [Tenacibaculum sp. SG-28]|uniref:hypothetical protein n=1 Tax=Tenacibaculum sp. SG-28 TaxID=754426 RepID=UPI0018EAD375|nr:hypothetical protein [Tenacibaculum sp. SG-28]
MLDLSVLFQKIFQWTLCESKLRRNIYYQVQQNELKTSDSLLTQKYLNFAKEFPESYFSMYAIDRIYLIAEKQRRLKINQVVGKWKWELTTNTLVAIKEQMHKQIEFDKNSNVRF